MIPWAAGGMRVSKFGNKQTVVGDRRFASQREANRYGQLCLLEKAARIRNLKFQVPFKIEIGGKLICRYISDFTYEEFSHGDWHLVVEDSKGFKTPVYKLKKKLMKALLDIEIRES